MPRASGHPHQRAARNGQPIQANPAAAARRGGRRPTYAELRAAGAAEEREAAIEFIRDKMSEVEGLKQRRRITAQEAALLNRRLDAIADGIAAGLHR